VSAPLIRRNRRSIISLVRLGNKRPVSIAIRASGEAGTLRLLRPRGEMDDRLGHEEDGSVQRNFDEGYVFLCALLNELASPILIMVRVPQLFPKKTAVGSIATIDQLCNALSITEDELREVILLPDILRYSSRPIPKKDGSLRFVHNPHFRLRRIQRRINNRLFSNQSFLSWPDHIFGSIPNQQFDGAIHAKDYVACARVHCESKSILTIDIANFFDNVHISHVLQIFRDLLKFSEIVSEVLADICCHNDALIQGALTSSYIAGLALYDVEGRVVERLARKGLRYTRLVDDINVSSKNSEYNFDYAKKIVEDMLFSKDLPVNTSKTKVQFSSTLPLAVHGLRVGFKEPRLPGEEVSRIRAAVHSIEMMAREPNYRTSHAYRRDFNRCMGRVNKLSRVGHKQHGGLVHRLHQIMPLPSQKDVQRAIKIVEKLEADFSLKRHTYWYAKRFYLAHERLNILKRSFPGITDMLRLRLKPIKARYE